VLVALPTPVPGSQLPDSLNDGRFVSCMAAWEKCIVFVEGTSADVAISPVSVDTSHDASAPILFCASNSWRLHGCDHEQTLKNIGLLAFPLCVDCGH